MKLPLAIRVFCSLCFAITSTLAAASLSLAGCPEKCGNVTIPYPFGIGSKCSANSSYTIICQNLTNPSKPFLTSIKREIIDISFQGVVIVNQPVSPMNCSDEPKTALPISLKGSPFTVSAHYNSLVVMGCKNSVWLRANETTVGGCSAFCDANSTYTSCNGVNCCQTTIPTRQEEIQFTYESIHATNTKFCGYVFPVDKKWLQNGGYKRYKGLQGDLSNPFDQEFRFAPLVLEWEFGNEIESSGLSCKNPDFFRPTYDCSNMITDFYICEVYRNNFGRKNIYSDDHCHNNPYDRRCKELLDNYEREYRFSFYYSEYDYVSSSGYCSCSQGFEGNPYMREGCSDIDECSNAELYNCGPDKSCTNTIGGFSCDYNRTGYYIDDNDGFRNIIKIASIVIGSVLGVLILLTAAWKSGKAITKIIKAIKASRKYMFFKRNGGLLLEQQLAAIHENGLEKTRLFSSGELAKATDEYNENRIVGRGGEGIVYKGMLEDGRIVAVKKSERVHQGDVEAFINEIVIVSQINHRNVVKLIGCCLESEVPRLVYEFIPNGTLFHHIHDPHEDFPLFWEMRVRIAKEVAGALAYLHSAASVPIYHRDIKSTNILLDEKYRAKISDFGTSRSVLIDQTHLTTRVVGTFGYLDPEYFQSSQFTEKSDVYSFGVVLVELLTGEKAISAARIEEGRGLAMHFLHSMEENQLFDILDARVLKEGTREEIEAMAEVARKCLHLNGKSRPTMKEVARDLDAIQVAKEESDIPQNNQIESSSYDSSEDGESDEDFSSIKEIMQLHTITSHSPDSTHEHRFLDES